MVLVRLDDYCENLDWGNWQYILQGLDRLNIVPLIACIPCNRDEKLLRYPKHFSDFGDALSALENFQVEIGHHGLNHVYRVVGPGSEWYRPKGKSEFASQSFSAQYEKLQESERLFLMHGVTFRYFIAPGHSFDDTTLEVFRSRFKNVIVSDGFFNRPVTKDGINFIPCHFSSLKWSKYFKVYTLCLHPNTMTKKGMDNLLSEMENYVTGEWNEIEEFCSLSFKDKVMHWCLNKLFILRSYVWILRKDR